MAKANGKPSELAKECSVMLDQQGVRYLRVGGTMRSVHLILNNGRSVDLIDMDNATVRGRDLQRVPNGSVLEAARQLAKPMGSGVQISPRAATILQQILQDKEILAMARVAVAVKTKPAAEATEDAPKQRPVLVKGRKAAAPAKAAKTGTKAKAAKADSGEGRAARDAELMGTSVVATDKALKAREGSFWQTMGKLASKPIKLGTLIEKLCNTELSVRSDKLAKDADALAASVRIRVRDSFNRLGFLKAAK